MDAQAVDAIGTALNASGLAMGTLALAVSAVTYFLSRAGKVRSFEERVYSQLTNAASRIERLESQWAETKTHLNGLVDEMVNTTEKTAKERRRLYAEHRREAEGAGMGPNGGQPDLSRMTREEQLRHVRAAFAGRA